MPRGDVDRVAGLIVSATGGEVGSCEVCVGAGERKASFAVVDELPADSFRNADDWIADDAGALCPFLVGAVVDEHRTVDADLLSCESCAVCGGVGSEHVCQ